MKIRRTLIVLIVAFLASVSLRTLHLKDAVDYMNGLSVNGHFTNIALPVVLIGSILVMLVMALMTHDSDRTKEYPDYAPSEPSVAAGVFAILAGLAVGVNSTLQLLGKIPSTFSGTRGLVYAGLGLTVFMAFIFIAVSFFKGDNSIESTPLIMLFPVLWSGVRLVMMFMYFTTVANINENIYDIVMLVFELLFFVFFGKLLIGTGDNCGKWTFAAGVPAALMLLVTNIPRYLLAYFASRDNSGKYAMSEITVAAFVPEYIDIVMGAFIVAALIYISRPIERAGAFEPGRLNLNAPGAPVTQVAAAVRPMGAAQPITRTQPAVVVRQQPAARNVPVQRPMPAQQRMPVMGGPMGYPQAGGMPMQNMYGAPGMGMPMAAMGGMPMAQMRGMPMAPMGGMPMNGAPMGGMPMNAAQMGGMPMNAAQMGGAPMNGMPAQAAASPGVRQPAQQGLLRGGGADSFTQKGAGLRVADSFQVRSNYTGRGRKFSGLDDFRSGMLSGRQALEDIEEDDSEEIETGAAELLQQQNAELENMQQSVEQALENAQVASDNAAEPPVQAEVTAASDDGLMPEPEPEHVPVPAARTSRDVRLGSGRGGGRLADRLEQRRPRRYDEQYEEGGYDEDEYEEYEEEEEEQYEDQYGYNEVEYGSSDYSYEYSNGYAPRGDVYGGAYDGAYYDGEYDGEYEEEYDEYDDEEYDEEYDDEYYDEDDEYYEDDEEYYGDEG